jgi:hypothetical protein
MLLKILLGKIYLSLIAKIIHLLDDFKAYILVFYVFFA